MKILVTGATGLVGRNLLHRLLLGGHDVRALARSPDRVLELPPENVFAWSDDKVPPLPALRNLDAIVHLAGEGIADARWTAARKQRLRDSRIIGTQNLVEGLANLKASDRPKALISASAVGYYGNTGDESVDEHSEKGKGFLPELCSAWEDAARAAEALDLRVAILRLGVVLAKDGGALSQMVPAIAGNGKQWMSWIHIDDLTRFIQSAIEDARRSGVYNLTSPEPEQNRQFTRVFAKALGYPIVIPTPAFALKLALGEMSEVILTGQRVLPTRTLQAGFHFEYQNLENALKNLYGEDSFLDTYFVANQFVPLTPEEIFPFFSRAENLESLTPPWLNFHIVKKSTDNVEAETLIDYKLKIHGIPVRWRSRIREWNPNDHFVDDQLSGPYNKWHHMHRFVRVPGGTLLRDEVTFRAPGSIFGKMLLTSWIRRDVNQIFKFRQQKIRQLQNEGLLK